MEKIYKASRVHLPFYWWFILPPVIFGLSLVFSVLLFSDHDDRSLALVVFVIFFILYIFVTIIAKIFLKTKNYISLTDDGINYFGPTGRHWQIRISDIEAMDDKQGEYRASASAVGLQGFIKTEFVIKAKGQYYNSYIGLADYQDLLKSIRAINPGVIFKNLYPDYSVFQANKVVVSDKKLFSAGNKIFSYFFWVIGIVLVLFCVYVIFVLFR